jgi:hypothetical protein
MAIPLSELGEEAYQRAILVAAQEVDRGEDTFPATFEQTGWSWEQASIVQGVFP